MNAELIVGSLGGLVLLGLFICTGASVGGAVSSEIGEWIGDVIYEAAK